MGRPLGDKVPDRVSITFSPINLRDMNISIKNKEFKTIADLVNTALRYYFENRNESSSKEEFKAWITSDDGEKYIKTLIRKVRDTK